MISLLVMVILVAVIVLGGAAVGAGFVVASKRLGKGQNKPLALAAPAGRSPSALTLRDVVLYMGDSYMIEGKLTITEHGATRWACRVTDGPKARWLYVTEGDRVQYWLVDPLGEVPFEGSPPDRATVAGATYRLKKLGKADVRGEGVLGDSSSGGRMGYHHYEAHGDRVLIVEESGGQWRALSGRKLEETAVELLPGDLIATKR